MIRRVVALSIFFLLFTLTAQAAAGGYNTPTAGQSPHGGYADATTKCRVCHAVHNAASVDTTQATGTEALLRSLRGVPEPPLYENHNNGNACVYCHIVGSWAILKVYDGLLSNYREDSRYNHDDNHRWFHARIQYAGCMSCHSVHGADCVPGYESKIVSNNPGLAFSAPVTNLTDFCRDCHEDTASGWADVGFHCGNCHVDDGSGLPFAKGGTDLVDWTDQMPPFFVQDRNGNSHIMTTTLTGNYGTQVAWADSSDCRDCHMGGNDTTSNNFPHYTSGAYFLDDDFRPIDDYESPDTQMDRVCLNCHVEGGNGDSYSTGVGKTF